MGWGRGNACQASQAAIIFNLAPSCSQVAEPVLLYTVSPSQKQRRARGILTCTLSSSPGVLPSTHLRVPSPKHFPVPGCPAFSQSIIRSISVHRHSIFWGRNDYPIIQMRILTLWKGKWLAYATQDLNPCLASSWHYALSISADNLEGGSISHYQMVSCPLPLSQTE